MVVIRFSGGLGNQMFQYAAGLAISDRLKTNLLCDIDWFKHQNHRAFELNYVFGLDVPLVSEVDKKNIMGLARLPVVRRLRSKWLLRALSSNQIVFEPHFHYWPGILDVLGDIYLDGYWQSDKYFSSVETKVRENLKFGLPFDDKNEVLAALINNAESVSLHIRRGDFFKSASAKSVHGVDLSEYYKNALDYVEDRLKNPHYFVFSDDPDWVRCNFKISEMFTVVSHNSGGESYRDMHLMSICKHHVLANSTFSWWGAWLNKNEDKIVVAPSQWFANTTNTQDLLPKNWVCI